MAAQEGATNKPFFLPKSPAAAAYVLGRLSNKELAEAPRSEFVYTAVLQRKGLERKYRMEALSGLAAIRHTDTLTEAIRGIDDLDQKGEEGEPILRELASILLQNKPADLAGKQSDFARLAGEAQQPLTRQIGYAAMITGEGSADKVWQQAENDPAKVANLLLAIPLLRPAPLRAALYPKVEPLLHKSDAEEARRAAITAIADIPGHDSETFNTLGDLLKSGTERAAVVASLQRIPRKSWPKEQATTLVDSLIGYLQAVPVDQRTEPDAVNAFQFASDLTSLMPPAPAIVAARSLRSLGVTIFVIRTIREQMLYDKILLVAESGKPLEIILINDDAMPHNIVIVTPGALEEIGQLAEKLPPEPDADGRLYIPNSPKVLYGTKLADPGQQVRLSFTAPSEPGDYQYVCTFPGHWRRMTGTLAVVKDVEAYLANHTALAQPKMTEWKINDFQADLASMGVRNLDNGKELFTKLGCAQCHKLGGEGANYGPDLTDMFHRYNNDRATVLRQVLEPSLVISNRYVNYEFVMKDGDSVFGMIVKEDADKVTAQTGPSDALIQPLKKSDIKERRAQGASVMPVGLLNTISKEQILNLLAYIEAGGKAGSGGAHP